MNLPLGTALKTGLDVASVDFFALLKELHDKRFNGYVALAVQGASGIEEGTQLFDEGKPVASFYEYYRINKTLYGHGAFERVLNASAANAGVIEVFELSNEQVHLVVAFNEPAIFVPTETDLRPRQIVFSNSFEEAVRASTLSPTRGELLKKYRLSQADVSTVETGGLSSLPVGKAEDLLEKLVRLQQGEEVK